MAGSDLEWYLYMVRCRDGSLYTGIATDIERRLAEHQSGKGAKYLRGRSPLKLAFSDKIGRRSLALKIERSIKRLSKDGKERIVAAGIDINQLLRRRKRAPPSQPRSGRRRPRPESRNQNRHTGSKAEGRAGRQKK